MYSSWRLDMVNRYPRSPSCFHAVIRPAWYAAISAARSAKGVSTGAGPGETTTFDRFRVMTSAPSRVAILRRIADVSARAARPACNRLCARDRWGWAPGLPGASTASAVPEDPTGPSRPHPTSTGPPFRPGRWGQPVILWHASSDVIPPPHALSVWELREETDGEGPWPHCPSVLLSSYSATGPVGLILRRLVLPAIRTLVGLTGGGPGRHEARRLGVVNPGPDASSVSGSPVACARVAARVAASEGHRARRRIRRWGSRSSTIRSSPRWSPSSRRCWRTGCSRRWSCGPSTRSRLWSASASGPRPGGNDGRPWPGAPGPRVTEPGRDPMQRCLHRVGAGGRSDGPGRRSHAFTEPDVSPL